MIIAEVGCVHTVHTRSTVEWDESAEPTPDIPCKGWFSIMPTEYLATAGLHGDRVLGGGCTLYCVACDASRHVQVYSFECI